MYNVHNYTVRGYILYYAVLYTHSPEWGRKVLCVCHDVWLVLQLLSLLHQYLQTNALQEYCRREITGDI